MDRKAEIKQLHEKSGFSYGECKQALEYCKSHLDCTPLGYLRAKGFAVRTSKLTFEERVRLFSKEDNN